MLQKLFVLNGGLGWKVEVQKVYLSQQRKISKVKKALSVLAASLVVQQEETYALASRKSAGGQP